MTFQLMAKPVGPLCNLDCKYCFFTSKESMYTDKFFRMSDDILEIYIRTYIDSQMSTKVTFAWQGGEPTLAGLPFFEKVILLQNKYAKGKTIANVLQTNGTLLNDDWGRFLKQNNFLAGISIDGPRELHNANRTNKGGKGSFDAVIRGYKSLQKWGVDTNILCTVNSVNEDYPVVVYRYFRDNLNCQHIQFIPIVVDGEHFVSQQSVYATKYGKFLVAVFDEWRKKDIETIHIQQIDELLSAYSGRHGVCVYAETCGSALVMDHKGYIFNCDHYVDEDHYLGNISDDLNQMAAESKSNFGSKKKSTLPSYCKQCKYLKLCNGGCPKDRDQRTGINYLCEGYKMFFSHTEKYIERRK